MQGKFSVIIPTLQRSQYLYKFVDLCEKHQLVGEVIIVNNSDKPIVLSGKKVKVLDQGKNIFVNPAWNRGAKEARYEYLAIVNDDLLCDPAAFDISAKILEKNVFGIVGPDKSCFDNPALRPRVRLARIRPTVDGFGTFMCLRRSNYIEIPDSLKIWGGDDILIQFQNRPPGVLIGVPFETEMSTTSGDPSFQGMRQKEHERTIQILDESFGSKWWHKPFNFYNSRVRPWQDKLKLVIMKTSK
ncbi:glycosyltransferase family 2 protein [Rothia sp. 11254D007CT]